MAETELEKLVVRLVGDNTSYQRMIESSVQATDKFNQSMTTNSRIMKEGERVTRSLQTESEKLGTKIGDLAYLYSRGAITLETYVRGIKAAGEAFKEAQGPANVFMASFEHLGLTGLALRLKALHEAYEFGKDVGKAWGDALFGVNEYNKAVEKLEMTQRIGAHQLQARQGIREAEIAGIADPKERAKAVEDQIKAQEEAVKGKKFQAGIEKSQLEMEFGKPGDIYRTMVEKTGGKDLELAQKRVADANREVEESEKRLIDLRKEAQIEEIHRNNRIEAYIRRLNMQTAALQGSKEAAAALRAEQLGATPEELKRIDAAAKAYDEAKAAEQAQKDAERTEKQRVEHIENINKKLQEQIDTYGMSAKQLEVYRLQQLGANEADIAAAQSKADQLDALKKHDELMRKGESLTKQFGTPEEQRAEKMKELDELLKAGAISEQTYQRALMGTKKEKHDVMQADAALIGSEAAYTKMIEYANRTLLVSKPGQGAAMGGESITERYQNRLKEQAGNLDYGGVPTVGLGNPPSPTEPVRVVIAGGGEGIAQPREIEEVLKQIRDEVKGTVVVKVANLE